MEFFGIEVVPKQKILVSRIVDVWFLLGFANLKT